MQFSATCPYFLRLRAKYLPQYPVLDHPLPIIFPSCDKRCVTPI